MLLGFRLWALVPRRRFRLRPLSGGWGGGDLELLGVPKFQEMRKLNIEPYVPCMIG